MAVALIGVAAALVATLIVDTMRGTPSAPAADQEAYARLPDPVEPAFKPTLRPTDFGAPVSRWAPVLRSVAARRSPGAGDLITRLSPSTPEGLEEELLDLGLLDQCRPVLRGRHPQPPV